MGGLYPPAVRHVPILVEAEARPGLEEAGRGSLVRPSTEHRGGRGGQKVVTYPCLRDYVQTLRHAGSFKDSAYLGLGTRLLDIRPHLEGQSKVVNWFQRNHG